MGNTESTPLRVTLYSDFTCPYCYLVERSSLPRLAQKRGGLDVNWQPFEVEPGGAPEGLPPNYPWYQAFAQQAAQFGLTRYQVPSWVPDTTHVMALAEYARHCGLLDAFRERALVWYWEEQQNLDGDEALGELARQVGLNVGKALQASRSKKWRAKVQSIRKQAQDRGVAAVPAVDFGHGIWVVGARDDRTFERALAAARELDAGERERGKASAK